MPEEVLDTPVQFLPHPSEDDEDGTQVLQGFYSGSCCRVSEWCADPDDPTVEMLKSRSPDDNAHHPERYALLTDGNPFNGHGDTAYLMQFGDPSGSGNDRFIGNVSGKHFNWDGEEVPPA